MVAFGGMPWSNGQINAGGTGRHVQREHMIEARDAGIEFVNVGPIRVDVDDSLDAEWLAIRPGTDAALLIAIAKTLLDEQLADSGFLEKYTVGIDKFQNYLKIMPLLLVLHIPISFLTVDELELFYLYLYECFCICFSKFF